jgi:hypothetical protein
MVVSDCYGLRRYQTGDLFECRRTARAHLPDLAFLRRRGLEYSFIGEKVTAEQLGEVFKTLRERYPELLADAFLTCVPSLPDDGLPQYKIVSVILEDQRLTEFTENFATECDELLSDLNCEYRNKRASGMLAPARFIQTNAADFAARFADGWETQFKFLPLYQQTWESRHVPQLNASKFSLSHKNTAQPAQTTSLQ